MHAVIVRLDRVQLVSWARQGRKAPRVKGFKVTRDSFVRSQTNVVTYERCRQYQSKKNDAKIYWQYWPRQSWLARWKVTIVADDNDGLSYEEIDAVIRHCRFYRFLTIEIAIDFSPSTGVNCRFVRRHAIFGKSRRAKRDSRLVLYWGGRKSGKLVRCYEKEQLESYRVELEFHSRFLPKEDIETLDDFDTLAVVTHPRHFQFVDVHWRRLTRYLSRKRHGQALIAGAQKRAASISRLRRYLHRKGIVNFHRFLVPLPIHEKIKRAFARWMRDFQDTA